MPGATARRFRPPADVRAASSSSGSNDPTWAVDVRTGVTGVPHALRHVRIVKSAGSTSGTSSHVSGVETRRPAPGDEYAEATVRSRAFWL